MTIMTRLRKASSALLERSEPETKSISSFFGMASTIAKSRAESRRSYPAIERAQRLYDNDSYCKELVTNCVAFALGKGVQVETGSEYIDRALANWRWSSLNRAAGLRDLQYMALTHLIRDGDIFTEKRVSTEGEPRLHFINGLHIRGEGHSASTEVSFNGVVVDKETLEPKGYWYRPYASGNKLLRAADIMGKRVPAESVIHIYSSEYSVDTRGHTWLQQSLEPLEELAEFDRLSMQAANLASKNPGFFKVPLKYLKAVPTKAELQAMSTDDQEKAAAAALVQEGSITDTNVSRMLLPDDVAWQSMDYKNFADAAAIEAYTTKLLTRAARGMGVSLSALTADFGEKGFLSSKFAIQSDVEFYRHVQSYLVRFMYAVLEFWVEVNIRQDIRFRNEYKGLVITPTSFQYTDPAKDALALTRLVRLGVLTPQQIVRDKGDSWEKVKAERLEEAQLMAEIAQIAGVAPTGGDAGE